jgi:virginiamycin B lyase
MRLQHRVIALVSAIVLLGSVCYGATVTGSVKGVDGAPFQGAFVQAQNTKTKITVNVLSDSQGHYRIEKLPAGDYRLTIRAVGFSAAPGPTHTDSSGVFSLGTQGEQDSRSRVSLTADQNAAFDFALQKGTVKWSDISQHQGWVLFPPGKGKDLLIDRCSICHGFQSRMAAVRRDADGWKDRVEYMRTAMHFGLSGLTDQEANEIATYLTSLFGPDSVLPKSPADMPQYKDTVTQFSSDAMNIVYVEYDMPGPSRMPFSAAPDKDGNLWIPNFGVADKITRLNPNTGEMTDFQVPFQGTAAIHSAVPGPDGAVWLTEQGANRIARWDPVTQKITEFQDAYLPGKEGTDSGGQKHTIRLDPSGNVWASGLPLTKFDPETRKFTRLEEASNGRLVYDVKPDKNGDVWYTSPGTNEIGKVDGKTMKITKWPMPTANCFPRRMEIAPDGIVWIGEFNTGKMARFDPKTQTFTEYKLPGPDPTPYGMGIDSDGNVWYNSHRQDTMGRVDPKTGKVTEYPFPHPELSMREFFRDAQGRMWYGTNPNNKVGYFYLTKTGGTSASGN